MAHACSCSPDHVARPAPVVRPSNSLGVAGFVVSLTGLIATCGVISPIGLVLSFFALFRKPRGFAFAGFVLGLVGSVWVFVALLAGLVAAGGVAAGVHMARQHMEYADDYKAIAAAVETYRADAGFVPASLLELSGLTDEQLKDQWGNYYNYSVGTDGQSFTLKSDGPDGTPGTDDDFDLPPGPMFDHVGPDNAEEVIEAFKHGGWHKEFRTDVGPIHGSDAPSAPAHSTPPPKKRSTPI